MDVTTIQEKRSFGKDYFTFYRKRVPQIICGTQKFLLTGLEGVLQADTAVEHQVLGGAILAVGAEVAQAHELEGSVSVLIG